MGSTSGELDAFLAAHDDDVLMHYGVKGMRWGVRKQRSSSTSSSGRDPKRKPSPAEVRAASKKRAQALDAERRQPSADAAKAQLSAIKAKSSGTKVLSNAEMRQLIERINLERQYASLQPQELSTGAKFLKNAVQVRDFANSSLKFLNTPAGRLLTLSIDKMIRVNGKEASTVSDLVARLNGREDKKDKDKKDKDKKDK